MKITQDVYQRLKLSERTFLRCEDSCIIFLLKGGIFSLISVSEKLHFARERIGQTSGLRETSMITINEVSFRPPDLCIGRMKERITASLSCSLCYGYIIRILFKRSHSLITTPNIHQDLTH